MRTKNLLVSCIAILALVFAMTLVSAGAMQATIDEVSVNGIASDEVMGVLALGVSEDVDVTVKFTVTDTDNLEDVKVKAWISGYKNDIEASTARFEAISGRTYIKKLSLELPEVRDIDDLDEDLTLHIQVSNKYDDVEAEYVLTIERETYSYNLLSVEAPSSASAGEILAIDVVLKNTGREELEDSFVVARIPELGIYKKVYFGDLAPEDNWDDDDDAEDARERRIYLVIPSDAETGNYDLEVKASNYDIDEEVVETIAIKGVTSEDNVIDTTDDDSEDGTGVPNSIIVLTVVLVVVFVVLLIVLIVLLTKKPAEKEEDFGETSYY